MCYHYTSTDMRPQSLLPHVMEKQLDESVNFELRKKSFDDKSGLYTFISFHFPLCLEKIEEQGSEGGYHRSTNSNDTEGQNSFQKTINSGCSSVLRFVVFEKKKHGRPYSPVAAMPHVTVVI